MLVDEKGVVVREKDQKEVKVTLKKYECEDDHDNRNNVKMDRIKNIERANEAKRRSNASTSNNSNSTNTSTRRSEAIPMPAINVLPNLTNEQTSELAKLGLIFISGLTILKILKVLLGSIFILVLPLIILYAMSTCPTNDSFDAKKELKRVLRGHHLPENHPDKPKDDWFSSAIARVTASVATELATSLGYELHFFVSGRWKNNVVCSEIGYLIFF